MRQSLLHYLELNDYLDDGVARLATMPAHGCVDRVRPRTVRHPCG